MVILMEELMKFINTLLFALLLFFNAPVFCAEKQSTANAKASSEQNNSNQETFTSTVKSYVREIFDFGRCVGVGFLTGATWAQQNGNVQRRTLQYLMPQSVSEDLTKKFGWNFMVKTTNEEEAFRYATVFGNLINITKPFNFSIPKRLIYTALGVAVGYAMNCK